MIRRAFILCGRRMLSVEAAAVPDDFNDGKRLKRIGKALETYLRQSREHSAMMAKERADFDLGKRHLAAMMGLDAQSLTQDDVNKYVLPLFDKKARPIMASPDEILPKFHRIKFDDEGRPEGSRFFTLRPKFYSLLSEVGAKTLQINRFYYERISIQKNDADLQKTSLSGTCWLSQEKMSKKLAEPLTDELYAQLIIAFDYLCSLPGSVVEAAFIGQYRESVAAGTSSKIFDRPVPEAQIDPETNRRFATSTGRAKDTNATAVVTDAGKGVYEVDGHGFDTFRSLQAREILIAPLLVAGVLGRVDVRVTTDGSGGESATPRACRHAVALCVAALYPEAGSRLRLAGLLTRDPRKKERSKVNQPGARAKWIWKRR